MAAIRKRTNPRTAKVTWQAQILRTGYPSRYRTFDRRTDADAWARDIERAMDRGEYLDKTEGERTSLDEALERYKKEITPRKAATAQVSERNRIKRLEKRCIARIALVRLRGTDIAGYISERQSEGAGSASVNRDLATISHLYTVSRTAWGLEYLQNPVPLAKTA